MQADALQLTADKELLVSSIPLATAFTKNLGSTFLPSPPSASKEDQPTPAEALEGYNQTSSARLVSSATQDKFRKLLCAYFEALSRRAVRDHTVSGGSVDDITPTHFEALRLCLKRTSAITKRTSEVERSSKTARRTMNVLLVRGRSFGPGRRGERFAVGTARAS